MRTGELVADRYRLRRSIGHGGMARVWAAWDEVLQRPVAVKLVNPELLGGSGADRFRVEARTAAGLSHPNIVTVYDYGEEHGEDGREVPYLVMELLEGETLAERLNWGGLAPEEAVWICAQVAVALAQAHKSGVVHRDVKPANIFLTSQGIKVLDFGIATSRGTSVKSDGPTEPLLGTPAYLAPEQRAEEEVTPASDVYALGVVLTEALTGRRTPEGFPEEVPEEIVTLCERCLESVPANRPTAAEAGVVLTGSLEAMSDAGPEEALPPVVAAAFAKSDQVTDQVADRTQVVPRRRPRVSNATRVLLLTGGIGLVAAALVTAALPLGERMSWRDPVAAIPASPVPDSSSYSARPQPMGPLPPSPIEPSTPAARPSGDLARGAAVLALSRVRELIARGKERAEIRSDVALDLDQVVTGVQREVAAGRLDVLDQRVQSLLRKVATRLREGGLTRPRAEEINRALTAVVARPA